MITNKYLAACAAVVLCLFSCKEKVPEKQTLFMTTTNGDLYSFNVRSEQLNWVVPGTPETDELSYFSFKGNDLIKAYLDRRIVEVNGATGKVNWTYKDEVSPSQSYYGYDFKEVRFVMFGQFPLVYKNAMLYANSHGELKSVDLTTKKTNWTYQVNIPIVFSPVRLNDKIVLNLGYRVVTVQASTGKLLEGLDFKTPIPNDAVVNGDRIYVTDERGNTFCMDENLNLIWDYQLKEEFYLEKNLVVGEEEVVFGEKSVFSLNKKDGKLNWETLLSGKTKAEIPDGLAGDKLLSAEINGDEVSVNTNHLIVVLDRKNGKVLRKKQFTNKLIVGMMRYNNGYYYYLGSDKKLYKIDKGLEKEVVVYKGPVGFSDASAADAYLVFK